MKRYIIMIIMACLLQGMAHAQTDPVLAGLILKVTLMSEKMYAAQTTAQGLQTTGHIGLEHEVAETKEYQKQFDSYLSSFRCVISYAAQAYGFYHEVRNLVDNMQRLTEEIGDSPSNAVALALHNKRNDIYLEVTKSCLGIINTIRDVCIDKKMTEQQRIELVFSVRPQLQHLNHKLAMLANLVRYTTMAQVWHGIENKAIDRRDGKAAILEESLKEWIDSGKSVKTNK